MGGLFPDEAAHLASGGGGGGPVDIGNHPVRTGGGYGSRSPSPTIGASSPLSPIRQRKTGPAGPNLQGRDVEAVMRDEEGDLEAVRMALDERLGRAPAPAYGRTNMAQLSLGTLTGHQGAAKYSHVPSKQKAVDLREQYKKEYLKSKELGHIIGLATKPSASKKTVISSKKDVADVSRTCHPCLKS